MQEKLTELISSYLESLFLHAKKSLKDTSQLRKARRQIARKMTAEVKDE